MLSEYSRNSFALGCALFVGAAAALAAAPPTPTKVGAYPDYGDSSIIVEWQASAGATGYRVLRAEAAGGPFAQVGGDLGVVTTFTDPGPLSNTKEYFYQVVAFNGDGASAASAAFQQNVKIIWPNTGGKNLLHGWNEPIGDAGVNSAGNSSGFHRGCDIQQFGTTTQNQIVVARGGRVATVGSGGADDNYLFVKVKIGATDRWDVYNHLAGATAAAIPFTSNTGYTRAGQDIQKIGKDHFTTGTIDFVDHCHHDTQETEFGIASSHPLLKFSAAADLDPRNVRPDILDHAATPGDKTAYYKKVGAAASTYIDYDPNKPDKLLKEDFDIHVELADRQNELPSDDTKPNGTTQTPTRIDYWILGPDGEAAVKTEASPYTLFSWANSFFGDPDGAAGLTLMAKIVDKDLNLGPNIKVGTVTDPWENYKVYIVTNTKGDTGEPNKVDADQYWNTNAKKTADAVTVETANFAGKPDATKASDARFPDGDYELKLKLHDLVASRTVSVKPVRVDNFPPAVKAIEQVNAGGAGACFNGLEIQFSETVIFAAGDLKLEDEGGNEIAIQAEFVLNDKPENARVVITPQIELDILHKYKLTIANTIKDRADKKLDSEFGKTAHNGTGGEANDGVTLEFCACADSADLNANGAINADDVGVFVAAFGSEAGDAEYIECLDYDANGQIDFLDWQWYISLL